MKNKIFLFPITLAVIFFASIIIIFSPVGKKNIIEVTPAFTNTPDTVPITTPTVIDEKLIGQSLAKKYNVSIAKIHFKVNNINSDKAIGIVSLGGQDDDFAFANWFLAVKKANVWTIVSDGNGTVPCKDIAPYSFPVLMVSECANESGQLIKL
jgi:hypothetical protein